MGWASSNRKEVLNCHQKPQDRSFLSFRKGQKVRSRILVHYIQIYKYHIFVFSMLIFIITMCLVSTGKYRVWQLQKKYFSQFYSKKLSDISDAIGSGHWADFLILNEHHRHHSIRCTNLIDSHCFLSKFNNIAINWEQLLTSPSCCLDWLGNVLFQKQNLIISLHLSHYFLTYQNDSLIPGQ